MPACDDREPRLRKLAVDWAFRREVCVNSGALEGGLVACDEGTPGEEAADLAASDDGLVVRRTGGNNGSG